MNITKTLLTTALLLTVCISQAKVDYNKDAKYQELRDSMTHGFNSGDSARFYTKSCARRSWTRRCIWP